MQDPTPKQIVGSPLQDKDRNRRRELVRIAYRHIADKGFEGLRVREVAAEARINNATLHYYFPTKEALIQGVVNYLMQEFSTRRTPQPGSNPVTPLEELHLEFEDLRYHLREMPDMFIVLTELSVRSRRDPTIAQLLERLDAGWRGYLISTIERGIKEGVFRPDIDVVAAAMAIMAQLKSIGYQVMGKTDDAQLDRLITQLAAQTEHWLTVEPPANRQRSL